MLQKLYKFCPTNWWIFRFFLSHETIDFQPFNKGVNWLIIHHLVAKLLDI